MKWKDLSLKERKQIYDSVRANNPDATYFDIKEQFDSIPTYEDGIRTLYDIRPDKQGFINRMNNLTPIEWAVSLGLPMFFGEEQENK